MNEKIDFSKFERITPRSDSFFRVLSSIEEIRAKAPPFGKWSAFALAASFLFIFSGVLAISFSNRSFSSLSFESNPPFSISWIESLDSLGESDLDILDSSLSVSYFITEDN